jgi:hypothetical protein
VNRALRAATLGVLLLSPLALSGCSAGRVTQTASQVRDKTGGQGQVGDLRLRQVELAYPDAGSYAAGADAELQLAIANDSSENDKLTSVSGTGFSRAVFTDLATLEGITPATGSSPSAAATPTATQAPASGATSAGSASAPPATGTGTGAGPTASSSAATTTTGIPVPAGQTVFVGPDEQGDHITLLGLDKSMTAGQYVTLTFTFEKAGDVTVVATVANPSEAIDRGSNTFDFNKGEQTSR